MKTAEEALPDDFQTLKRLLLKEREQSALKDARIRSLTAQYQHLLEQFRLAQHRRFGQRSEANPNQLELFNEAEQEAQASPPMAMDQEEIAYRRNQPTRKPLPKELPREQVIHDLDDADKVCDCCGHALHRMGEEMSEQLEFIPARLKVIEHIRPKYACRQCETQGITTPVRIAPPAVAVIPKSYATPSLLGQIIVSKYSYALPLYRQEALFRQAGIELSRKTMADWVIRSAQLLEVIYQRLKYIQLQQAVIHADETPIKVIHEDKVQCYMWVYCTGTDSPGDTASTIPNSVLYDYRNSRAGHCARDYLKNFRGYLQVDGYAGYEQTEATLVGCLAHARRKFVEAKKIQPKGKSGKADWALSQIRKLYRIESALRDQTPQTRQRIRQAQATPLLDEFKAWLDRSTLQVPPKSAIGKAITYSLNQWPKLIRYIDNGALDIDNNRAERAIKPFVIGRKNWMFANTAKGAHASAVLYSLMETAKANGLMPYDYLRRLLEELPKQPEDIDYLLPWNIELAQID